MFLTLIITTLPGLRKTWQPFFPCFHSKEAASVLRQPLVLRPVFYPSQYRYCFSIQPVWRVPVFSSGQMTKHRGAVLGVDGFPGLSGNYETANFLFGFLGRDEPPMTACGGNFIGGEISRNEQCPHEADLRQLRFPQKSFTFISSIPGPRRPSCRSGRPPRPGYRRGRPHTA